MSSSLTLPQALLLLTLKDETGEPNAGFYKPIIAGAGLSELLLRGSLRASDDKKPKLETITPPEKQSAFLDFIYNEVARSEKVRNLQYWVTKLGNHNTLIPTLAEELCELGALKKQERKVLGLFKQTNWPEASPKLETELKAELIATIEGNGEVSDTHSVIITMADAADILRRNFEKELLQANKARIKSIKAGELLATGATQAAVNAAKAAITAAMVAGTAGAAVS